MLLGLHTTGRYQILSPLRTPIHSLDRTLLFHRSCSVLLRALRAHRFLTLFSRRQVRRLRVERNILGGTRSSFRPMLMIVKSGLKERINSRAKWKLARAIWSPRATLNPRVILHLMTERSRLSSRAINLKTHDLQSNTLKKVSYQTALRTPWRGRM